MPSIPLADQTPAFAAPEAVHRVRDTTFGLSGGFSIACGFVLLLAAALTITLIGAWAREHLVAQASKTNAHLASMFANGVWSEHASDAGLRQRTLDLLRGTGVVKLDVHLLDGLTLFSTDIEQIGKLAAHESLRGAAGGSVTSSLTHQATPIGFDGSTPARDVLASYVPLRDSQSGQIKGVLAIHVDATDMLAALERAKGQIAAIVACVLMLLFALLFLLMRKADGIVRCHDAERRQRDTDAWHQAHHDPLTALPNRSLFAHDLAALLAQGIDRVSGALLYVDLDRFKMVNDGFGHQAGDEVLGAAAERMRRCLRADDRLYRVGGDEFAIVLPQVRTQADAAAVASRVTHAMAKPIEHRGQRFTLGATIGVAMIPRDGDSVDSLVSNANAAMRNAKRDHRGEHIFYSEAMNERTRARLALEAELQRAYDEREFVLHYQPRVGSGMSDVRSLEALIRWQRPGHGLMAPGTFIDVLEQMDLMTRVGEWVLRTACTQLRAWHDLGHVHVGVSVNVAARQLEQADFAEMVNRVIADTRVDPRSVELELTESALIARTEHAGQMLSTLRAQGVRVAIDDFGTGYASLTYLRQLAVDVVKLDRSFVGGVEHNPKDRALSTAIAEMARALDLTLVAEGVETEAQKRFLNSIHCTEMQGFLFSRPEPPEKLDLMLAAHHAPRPALALLTTVAAISPA
jgi:diguanylate cyclase (GGDEF)-like protein